MTDEIKTLDECNTLIQYFTLCYRRCGCGGVQLPYWKWFIDVLRNKGMPEKQIESFASQLCQCQEIQGIASKMTPVQSFSRIG
jgi:hypothetical protein